MSELQNQAIINEIRQILQSARENVARAVNNELLIMSFYSLTGTSAKSLLIMNKLDRKRQSMENSC